MLHKNYKSIFLLNEKFYYFYCTWKETSAYLTSQNQTINILRHFKLISYVLFIYQTAILDIHGLQDS